MTPEKEFEDALNWLADWAENEPYIGHREETAHHVATLRRLYREARKDGERLDWLDKDYGINRMRVALNPNWNPGPTRAIIDTAMEGE